MARTYSERKNTKTDLAFQAMPPERLTPLPVAWWQAQAEKYTGACPRCQGVTRSQYIAPRTVMGDCGVVQSCLLCGWERLQVWGRWGIPYGGEHGI